MNRLLLFFLCAEALLFSKNVKYEETMCEAWMYSRFGIAHREHKGVGFEKGYTTGSGFFTPRWDKEYQPFLDLKAHVFNNGYFASNIGAGSRFENHDSTIIYGVNAYFDHRGWKHLEANQFGAGFELLSRYVDFRLNGYWPFGKSYYTEQFDFYRFQGNGFLVQRDIRYAFPAADVDIGGSIPLFGNYSQLDLGVGSYYLFRQNANSGAHAGNAWGGKVRGEFDYSRWLVIGAEWTYDRIFHGRFNGYIKITKPFGWKKKRGRMKLPKAYKDCKQFRPMIRKRLGDVKRMEIIPMLQKKQITSNAAAGLSFPDFIFVNNEGQGMGAGVLPNPVGNGTYENPYNMLSTAETNSVAGDVIYLYYGDGTTANNDEGFTMKADQQLLGSGRAHTVDGVLFPAQTPGQTPLMTNTAGVGVTLANGAIVDGIQVSQPSSHVILGSNVSDSTVRNCILNATASFRGVSFTDNCGAITISNNTLSSPAGTGEGIYIGVDSADEVNITDNTINSGFNYAIQLLYTNLVSGGDITISGNTINNADVSTGVYGRGFPTTTSLTLANNTFNCSGSGALGVDLDSSHGITLATFALTNNTITSDDNCVKLDLSSATTVNLAINQSNILTSTSEEAINCTINNETSTVVIDGNTITTTGSVGVALNYSGSLGTNTQTATISSNNINTSGTALPINVALGLLVDNPHFVSTEITDNTFSNGANSLGIGINSADDSNLCSTITGNTGKSITLTNNGVGIYNIRVASGEPANNAGLSASNNGASVDDTSGSGTVSYILSTADCFP